MTDFTFHTLESAPAAARPALEQAQQGLGFVPSLYAGLAEAPAALDGYLHIADAFAASSLTAPEQQVVLLAASVENGCEFCVAAHSFIARNVAKLDPADIQALRDNATLPTAKHQALAEFTRRVVRDRGWVDSAAVDALLTAGYARATALEVVLGVAMKTLSNYANHLLDTPTDAAFADERWQRAVESTASAA